MFIVVEFVEFIRCLTWNWSSSLVLVSSLCNSLPLPFSSQYHSTSSPSFNLSTHSFHSILLNLISNYFVSLHFFLYQLAFVRLPLPSHLLLSIILQLLCILIIEYWIPIYHLPPFFSRSSVSFPFHSSLSEMQLLLSSRSYLRFCFYYIFLLLFLLMLSFTTAFSSFLQLLIC